MTRNAALPDPAVDDEDTFDTAVWRGVQTLLDDYATVRAEDTVVLLYTSDSYQAAAWLSAALEVRHNLPRRVWMAPLVDPGFARRLADALPEPDQLTGRLIVLSLERDTLSHGEALAAALAAFDPRRYLVLRAISAGASLFRYALHITPEQLTSRNAAVLNRLQPAGRLYVTTPGGTDLVITLNPRHRWISNRGAGRPGSVLILPAGEVATYPATIDGVLVADFAFNVNAVTDLDARLHNHPVTVTIADSRAVDVTCADRATGQLLDTCFARHNADHIGELGFGTNRAVDGAIALNSHINERRPGVHLGFGQHNQDLALVPYRSPIHLDLITRGGVISTGDGRPPLDLEQLPSHAPPHPINLLEQDVSSPLAADLDIDDCCGIVDRYGTLHPFQPPDE